MAYQAGDLLIRAQMEASTGLPADRVINDFAFSDSTAQSGAEITALFAMVSGFYRNTQVSGASLGSRLSNYINRGATHELQAYRIVAGALGSPLQTEDWLGPTTAAGADGLPAECAAVLSFHANLTGVLEESGATRPRARRRGRLFIGPLGTTALTLSTAPYYLNSTFLSIMREAAVELYDAATAVSTPWAVWSRTDATVRPIVAGWTDNAPDTMRSRGPKANVRTAWIP